MRCHCRRKEGQLFSPETIRFLNDLKAHNDRDWFQSQKRRYETHVKAASIDFAASFGELLSARYGVSVTAKLYRINRDLRFSKDKTPYNAHIHMSFIDPATQAAWMVGLETDRLVLGFGAFSFDSARLERWRKRVAGPGSERLFNILKGVNVRLDPPDLKRAPSPYPADHPAADLLRRKGFAVWLDDVSVETALGESAPAQLLEELRPLDPVRAWFVEEIG